MRARLPIFLLLACAAFAPHAAAQGASPAQVSTGGPLGAAAAWPSMRHDTRNSGARLLRGVYSGDRPWHLQTGRGIFSTPVIAVGGTIYIGSADHVFYAVRPDGHVRWRFRTGGIIDSAAAIGDGTVTVGSGDERLYRLRLGGDRPRVLWRFAPTLKPVEGQLVSWWEGNPAIGPDGDVYAGNTGGGAYRISPGGKLRWAYRAGNSVWTTPAFGSGGRTFWGSVDLTAFALDANGRPLWSRGTVGFVVSSPALDADGRTLYVASFDRRLYALDPDTGAVRWSFQTGDHVYSSPALGAELVYIASTDGSVYALDRAGTLRWRYDTGEPVRGSPVVGIGAGADGRGEIVYVGSGDGRLYALDGATGARRWSFDTTPASPLLRDRNDLNGSPALGDAGVYVAGEHGALWYVPYDYCRRRSDRRCSTDPAQPLGGDGARLLPVTSGGATRPRDGLGVQPAAPVLNVRLVARAGGATLPARLSGVRASLHPAAPLGVQLSGDGQIVRIVPRGFLRAGTRYGLRVRATSTAPGSAPRPVAATIPFRTAAAAPGPALAPGRALRIRRLALPLPSFITSVNQIGFDSYDLIAGVVRTDPGRALLWVIGGRRDAAGREVSDPRGGFAFALRARLRGGEAILSGRDLPLTFSFGRVPTRRFELRTRLDAIGNASEGSAIAVDVTCADVPVYGGALRFIGLCNRSDTLAATGTFLTSPYPAGGQATRSPRGVSVGAVRRRGRTVAATLRVVPGVHYRARDHLVALLLVDESSGEPVAIDYAELTRTSSDGRGDVSAVSIRSPRALPPRLTAYVMADAYPLAAQPLG